MPSLILVVDDEPDLRGVLAEVLAEAGHPVHHAADCLEALAAAAGLDANTISRIERGRRPMLGTVWRLADALGVGVEELAFGGGQSEERDDGGPSSADLLARQARDRDMVERLRTLDEGGALTETERRTVRRQIRLWEGTHRERCGRGE